MRDRNVKNVCFFLLSRSLFFERLFFVHFVAPGNWRGLAESSILDTLETYGLNNCDVSDGVPPLPQLSACTIDG